MKKYLLVGTIFGFGLAAIVLPVFIKTDKTDNLVSSTPVEAEKYPHLAKRVFVGNPNDMILNFISLRNDLKSYISGLDVPLRLYFEYLPTGVHIGINDRDEFYRASLVKVPLIMQLYKMIEDGYVKRDEMLVIRRDLLDETYGTLYTTGAGTSRSVEDLVRLVLVESDNTAYNVLLDRVNQVLYETDPKNEKGINNVYDFLDIPKDANDKTLQISPRSYASILKSLFFSSYLNYPESDEMLDIMSESKFNDWMPKELPPDVVVAHKVGIFQGSSLEKSVNSDCGIVYVPNRPYILCLMVRSGNTDEVKPYFSVISKKIYDYVSIINGHKK